jgi:probable phosphoglycerate mutase
LKLILVRHGETYWNEERRVQGGSSDIELNETGVKQANRVASFLKDENIAAVVSSPLKRAVVTAGAIAEQHQLSVEVDDRLREMEVGELEGLALSELNTTFSHFLMQWWQGSGSENLPGGESLVELQKRSWGAIERLLAEYKNGTVVAISHYFVVLATIFKALDLPLGYLVKFKLDPGGISVLEFEDYGTRLVTFNDTSYLREKINISEGEGRRIQ